MLYDLRRFSCAPMVIRTFVRILIEDGLRKPHPLGGGLGCWLSLTAWPKIAVATSLFEKLKWLPPQFNLKINIRRHTVKKVI